ncbi:hypothetical protein KCU64_g12738, partial [Aureobasidium melanogenum]
MLGLSTPGATPSGNDDDDDDDDDDIEDGNTITRAALTLRETARVHDVWKRPGMVEDIEIPIDDNHRSGGNASALPQATRTQVEKLSNGGPVKNDPSTPAPSACFEPR